MEQINTASQTVVATFDERLNWLIGRLNDEQTTWHTQNGNVGKPARIEYERGSRYVRLVRVDGLNGGKSAYGFIDATNGDILKSAGWKAPAKGPRGNIFQVAPMAAFTPYGVVYARR